MARRWDDRSAAKENERRKRAEARRSAQGAVRAGLYSFAVKNAPARAGDSLSVTPEQIEAAERVTPEFRALCENLGWYEGIPMQYAVMIVMMSAGRLQHQQTENPLTVNERRRRKFLAYHYQTHFQQMPPTDYELWDIGFALITDWMWQDAQQAGDFIGTAMFYAVDDTTFHVLPPAWRFANARLGLPFATNGIVMFAVLNCCTVPHERYQAMGGEFHPDQMPNPIGLSDDQLEENLRSHAAIEGYALPTERGLKAVAAAFVNAYLEQNADALAAIEQEAGR